MPEARAELPLQFRDGHFFLEVAGALWLLDTGAPASFAASSALTLAGETFHLPSSYLGLDAEVLSRFVGVECVGLLGADVLSRFDFLLDAANRLATVSTGELERIGQPVELDEFMGIPLVRAQIRGDDFCMFLDTGAQVSYLQHDIIRSFPDAGPVTDFYPGVGQFETDTHSVAAELAGVPFTLRCGVLPGLLGSTLMMAGADGIIGNSVFRERLVGYFPRRRLLVLGAVNAVAA